jgi:hypothetical protein
MHSFLTKSPF